MSHSSFTPSSKTPCVDGLRDHDRGELVAMLLPLGAQIGEIDVPPASHVTGTTW